MRNTYEELLKAQGVLCTTTVGCSMRPLLREGKDVLEIRPAESYRKFDAVLFRRPGVEGRGAYVCHRILKVLPDGAFWVVGDNCTGGEIVRKENILGVLTGLRRGGKDGYLDSFVYRMYLLFWVKPYRFRIAVMSVWRFARRIASFLLRRILHIKK